MISSVGENMEPQELVDTGTMDNSWVLSTLKLNIHRLYDPAILFLEQWYSKYGPGTIGDFQDRSMRSHCFHSERKMLLAFFILILTSVHWSTGISKNIHIYLRKVLKYTFFPTDLWLGFFHVLQSKQHIVIECRSSYKTSVHC